jgi:hypothetical protein
MEPASLHAVGSRIAEVAIGVTPLTYFPISLYLALSQREREVMIQRPRCGFLDR